MVKYFTDVRKLLRTSKYVPYCREVGGFKSNIWRSRRIVASRTTVSVETFCIRSVEDSGSVFLIVSCNIPCWFVVQSWKDLMLAV